MKLPEFLFVVINPVMAFILRSPLHGILSGSIMLVTFTGRKSGKRYTTPVRYTRHGDLIRAYSTQDTQWWRNLRDGAEAELRVAGRDLRCRTQVIEDDPAEIRTRLEAYFAQYPQDAAYHDVRLGPDKQPVAADLERATAHAVVVEARPIDI